MAKRGRPKKIKPVETETVQVNTPGENTPDEVSIEGIAPSRYDVEDEAEFLEVNPYFEETARYGRNADDAMGGVGLNFGDW
jgi:GH25 family lysozyme M1 (1,4-beta-N-acetylmuramidase)